MGVTLKETNKENIKVEAKKYNERMKVALNQTNAALYTALKDKDNVVIGKAVPKVKKERKKRIGNGMKVV
jgi:cytochrome c oxidase assembly protein Cox11